MSIAGPRPKVVIIDDHEVLADCLAIALEADGLDVDVAHPNDEGLLPRVIAAGPALCLVDLDLGEHRARGLGLIPPLIEASIDVLVFTGSDDEPILGHCLELGATGIVLKRDGFGAASASIAAALRGRDVNAEADKYRWLFSATKARREHATRMQPFEHLTARESEVLGSLVFGLTVEQVADIGCVSVVTVRTQVQAIFRKLGVRSQLAAVAKARQAGWIPPPGTPGAPMPDPSVVSRHSAFRFAQF